MFRTGGRLRCVTYRTGPFLVELETDYPPLLDTLFELYPPAWTGTTVGLRSFHVQMWRTGGLMRRWAGPQVRFLLDGASPFEPYPLDHAFPLLEWGVNWCIAMRAHQFLMLHSAVVERGGRALILPAMPGAGKSTLCAGLALRGWRLLSDEFGLCDLATGLLVPLPRAVPLKNESIAVIRAFSADAHLGPLFPRTRKGDVSHLRPPADSLRRQQEPAQPAYIVFPRFEGAAPLQVRALTPSEGFVRLAQNAFNYQFLRGDGFIALTHLVSRCDCYSLTFGSLDDAVTALDGLCAA